MRHPRRRWALLLLLGAVMLALWGTTRVGRLAWAAPRLVVHEWGTFTVHFGSDGIAVPWRPLEVRSDLPEFVYLASPTVTRKGTIEGTVRMETPVLYFYADRRLVASVDVGFPDGIVSEWYPRGRRTRHGIRWPRVTVLPGVTATLPREAADSHYYPARETDAALVRVGAGRRMQHEKFLFYRGVGTFDLPLGARLDGGQVVVRVTGPEPITRALVVESRAGWFGYRAQDLSASETSIPLPEPAAGALAAFEAELRGLLVDQGLYEREAQAMLDTWRSTWTEEGLRVLYIVPRRVTDRVLPLDVAPAPAEVVRVLVGRGELL